MNVKVVVEQSEEGKYYIYVPSQPGVLAEGDTKDEAIEGLKAALSAHLEPHEEDLPADSDVITEIDI